MHRRLPRWTVTFPTRPGGLYSHLVRAADPTDAVRVAATLDWPTNPGHTLAFDHTPEVWRLHRPYCWRSRHAAGPTYPEDTVYTPQPATPEGA